MEGSWQFFEYQIFESRVTKVSIINRYNKHSNTRLLSLPWLCSSTFSYLFYTILFTHYTVKPQLSGPLFSSSTYYPNFIHVLHSLYNGTGTPTKPVAILTTDQTNCMYPILFRYSKYNSVLYIIFFYSSSSGSLCKYKIKMWFEWAFCGIKHNFDDMKLYI